LHSRRTLAVRGQVVGDYQARELKTPRTVRNARKHGPRVPSGVDAFSSALWFSGFAFRGARTDGAPGDRRGDVARIGRLASARSHRRDEGARTPG
jgi:hypothetical protein